jgi:hypothetical protein
MSYKTVFTSPPIPVIWSYAVEPEDSQDGKGNIVVTNIEGYVILPMGSAVPEGWNIKIRQEIGPGGPLVSVQGADTLQAQAGNNTSFHSGEGMCEIVRGQANGKGGFNWVATGNVFNSGKNEGQ